MAAKKSETSKKDSSGVATKAPAKKAAPKKKAASAQTASKAGTPKAASKTKAAPKKGGAATAVKKPTVRLTEKQLETLKKIHGAGESGYTSDNKVELRSLDNLLEKKLLKRGAKNKETGKHPYSVTKAGQKHVQTSPGSSGSGS